MDWRNLHDGFDLDAESMLLLGPPPALTRERLRRLLDLNPDDGVFRWRIRRDSTSRIGDIAGSIHKDGGVRRIYIDGQFHSASDLAWLYMTDQWPAGHKSIVSEPRCDISDAEAERLLMAIQNDKRFEHRDDWLDVLTAIHHQFNGNREGLRLALQWSATWSEDDPDYTEAMYETLMGRGGSTPKTFAWIIRLAAEAGVTPRRGA